MGLLPILPLARSPPPFAFDQNFQFRAYYSRLRETTRAFFGIPDNSVECEGRGLIRVAEPYDVFVTFREEERGGFIPGRKMRHLRRAKLDRWSLREAFINRRYFLEFITRNTLRGFAGKKKERKKKKREIKMRPKRDKSVTIWRNYRELFHFAAALLVHRAFGFIPLRTQARY